MPKQHKPWIFTAKAGGVLEILLYEVIGQDFWTGEGTTAKSFAEDLKAAGAVSKIHLRVNSPGGSVFDGLAIYNTLLSHGAKVTAQVDGLAASIASVIIMAASEISMGDNAMMMIHNPSTVIAGDSNDMRKMAETMDKVKTSMITAYRRHSTQSEAQIATLMDAETWMTAQETVDNGFAEKVITPEGDDADVAANFGQMFAKFRKVPQQIAARFSGSTSRTKRVDGENLTSDCFLYVGDEEETDTWHLPWKFSSEEKIVSHLRDALARFDQTDIPASDKPAVRAKLIRLCKEHGIKVSDKDAAAKALAKLIKAASRAPRAASCSCTCLPCSEENNCQDCTNEDCDDDNCDDCAMQAKAVKALRKQLIVANRQIETLKGDLAAAAEGKTQALSSTALNLTWLERMNAELEQGSALTASALKGLPAELTAAQESITALTAEVETLAAALAEETQSRLEEAEGHFQFSERLTGELHQAGATHAAAVEEITEAASHAETRVTQLAAELEDAETALTAEKQKFLQESTAQQAWADRLTAELSRAGQLYASSIEELSQRIAASETRIAQAEAETETAQAALTAEKKKSLDESTAQQALTERLTAEVSSVSQLCATAQAAAEEIPSRLAAAEARVTQAHTELESAQAALAAEKKMRLDESAAYAQSAQRLTAELSRAGELCAAAAPSIAAAHARVVALSAELESAQAALAAEKKTRLEESAAYVQSGQRVVAELARAGELCAAAAPSIAAADARVTSIAAELESAQAALRAEKESRVQETATQQAWIERLTADLRQGADFYAEALAELPRRARAAGQLVAQLDAQLAAAKTALVPASLIQLLEDQRNTRDEEAKAMNAFVDRVTASFEKGQRLYTEALEELPRRASAAAARVTQACDELAGMISAHEAAMKSRGEEATARAGKTAQLTAGLASASQLCVSAVGDLSRRSRTAETATAQIATDMGEVQTAMEVQAKARKEQATAQAAETERLTADLSSAVQLCAGAGEELSRRSRTAEAAAAQISTELADARTAMEVQAKARKEQATAHTAEAERLTADLSSAAQLCASAGDDLSRRSRTAEAAAAQISTELADARTAMEAGKKARIEEATKQTVPVEKFERVTADLKQAGALSSAAGDELRRRARAIEAGIVQITAAIETVETAMEDRAAAKKAKGKDHAARAERSERMTADLKAAGALYASALQELQRRTLAAQARIGDITAELAELVPSPESRVPSKTAPEEIKRLTAELKTAGTVYAGCLDELRRRARSDERRVAQLAEAQKRDRKKTRAAAAEARAASREEIERLTADLKAAAAIYAGAGEEIGRRARLASL
jgi:ATP-dependent Clp endopeptidase proteolytic subunit ClpP